MGKTTSEAKACDFVLFGTKGDLARRKLLPSLYQLDKAGLLNRDTKVIGVAKDEFSAEDFRELVKTALSTFVKEPCVTPRFPASSNVAIMSAPILPNLKDTKPSTNCSSLQSG